MHTGGCDFQQDTPKTTQTYIQLLQLSNYNYVEVIQCKIEISRTVYHCGMHSHVSIVHNGQASYLQGTSHEQCLRMHREGMLRLGADEIIDQLKPNSTIYRSVTLAGKAGVDGTCKGAMYSDYYGTWEDVVVQAQVTISLRTAYVPVHLELGKVILKSGTTCPLSEGTCLDSDDGYTFWQPLPNSACKFNHYDVLYEGNAMKMQGNIESQDTTIYTLTTQDITFALTLTRPHIICGYTLMGTEHPKLFIFETKQGNTFKTKTETPIDNLDIFTYINSKFVYVERHIRTQMKALYYDIIQQKCELEKQVLQNTLSLATLLPDEFAFRLMKAPGYMAVAAGEVIHVVKCIPLEVVLRRTNSCFTDLPVMLSNTSYFITPKSRILTRYSTERNCNPLLPIQFHIEDTWIQFNPTPNMVLPPQILKPLTKLTWTYLTPAALATSGIYSEKDLENLRDHDELDCRVRRVCSTSQEHLWETLEKEWNKIPNSVLEKLIERMPRLMKKVLSTKEGWFDEKKV
ncbi:uncharacterized protein LOC116853388 [Odontomachus brunneus]|uniref:uncharacterized protein LOC116853388 n=1 Tax=Odontomachus brunneus TaxID=486640 RepID=UPI0013F1DA95|nr:uncharacterized protein LOC116853388 [Odontomachus brunneus]